MVSIKKYNSILIEKGLLSEEVTDISDEAGLPVVQRSFNLTGLQQAALWIKAVTQQLTSNTEDIEELKQENSELKRRVAALEKEFSISRNKVLDFEATF